MKIKTVLCVLALFSPLIAHATNYQFSATLISSTLTVAGTPSVIGKVSNYNPVLSGSVDYNEGQLTLGGSLSERSISTITGYLEIDAFTFSTTSEVYNDYGSDYGGWGSEVYSDQYNIDYIDDYISPVLPTAAQLDVSGLIFSVLGSSIISFDGFNVDGYSDYCAWHYEDDSQTGTPTGGCDSNTYDLNNMSFNMNISHLSNFLGLEHSFDEIYLVQISEVPLPSAILLFSSGLALVSIRKVLA